jgi:hypothetical protein
LLTYIKPEKIILKAHPEFNEKWVQARIAEDPKILGLGNLVLPSSRNGFSQAEVALTCSSRMQRIARDDTKLSFNSEASMNHT